MLNNEITTNLTGSKSETLTYVSTTAGSVTYYVVGENTDGCISAVQSVTVTINPQVGTVTVSGSGDSYCQGQTVRLVAGATNATEDFEWFEDSQGTIPASNIKGTQKNTFELVTDTTTPTGTFELYVRATNASNCNSDLKKVSYTILTQPNNLQVSGDTDYCTGATISLTPSASNATSYEWATAVAHS